MKPRAFVLASFVFGVLVGSLLILVTGCATTHGPCLPPEAAFANYVARDLHDPTAAPVGMCETGLTEDTGDEFTICRVKTAKHGTIHKRLMTRTCWDSPFTPYPAR